MKTLVTGGAGFIGSHLVRLLVAEDHEVVNVDCLTYAGNLRSLEDLGGHLFVQADVRDGERMRALFAEHRPEWVMHLAAESHVDRSIDSPLAFVRTNVEGTFNMLEAARSYHAELAGSSRDGFRFIHVGTDEVFGSLGASGIFREGDPYDPRSPYSASKAASDHLAKAWFHTYGLPTVVTNCSNNYGPGQFPEKLIPASILAALKGGPIPVYGRGDNVRDWIYVEDHAAALCAVARKGRLGESYNIGADNELRNLDLVLAICGLLDELKPRTDGKSYTEQVSFVEDRPGHDFRYAIDAGKIRSEIGWEPRQEFRSGLRKTVQWYLEESS